VTTIRTANAIIADWHAGRADHDPYDEIGGLVAEVHHARRALRAIRDRVNADGDTPPGLSALIHSAVREGLGEDGQR
jgi:hypothetical protein